MLCILYISAGGELNIFTTLKLMGRVRIYPGPEAIFVCCFFSPYYPYRASTRARHITYIFEVVRHPSYVCPPGVRAACLSMYIVIPLIQ